MGRRTFGTFLILKLIFITLTAGVNVGGMVDSVDENESKLLIDAYKFSAAIIKENGQDEIEEFLTTVEAIEYGNELQASRAVCALLNAEAVAILMPSSPDTIKHIQSVCDEREIPILLTTWYDQLEKPFVSLYPHPETIETAIIEIVTAWQWSHFTLLYESAQWLPRAANLLHMCDDKGFSVTVRQLSISEDMNYRPTMKRVKDSADTNIIIECSIQLLPEVLKQAQQVGILIESYQYIITNLDMHTLDLEPYQYSGTNITGLRLIDPEDAIVQSVTESLIKNYKEAVKEENKQQEAEEDPDKPPCDSCDYDQPLVETEEEKQPEVDPDEAEDDIEVPEMLTAEKLPTSIAFIYDALLLFAEAFKHAKDYQTIVPTQLDCEENNVTWSGGYSLANYMKTSIVRGVTKFIKFDHEGYRREIELNVVELGVGGLQKIGTWNNSHGLVIDRLIKAPPPRTDRSMKNVSLVVITALSDPYAMLKEESQTLTGNDCFEGYAIDLIENLGTMLGFNYTFTLQENKAYGGLNQKTNQWNGMIREVLDGRADLAIVDLTITAERESAVDFTMPFMNLGISILYQKAKKQPPSFFSFLSPFSKEVWVYVGAAILSVSVSLFVLGRISPNEWDNPYPCIEEPEQLENQFSFQNAAWFTIGALLQQGTELAPKTASTRTIASIWWFFTLIMVSSYTANLAAFLTVELKISPIENVNDLANLDGAIQYGAKAGGSTLAFFKEAEGPMYQKMYEYMTANPHLLTKDNDEGMNRVKKGNYAFLMESVSIDYMVERHCELAKVGSNIDEKGYGIAMRKDFPFRGILSESVLRLQEQGKLTLLQTKWWKEKRGGGLCAETSGDSGALALGIAHVGGVFVTLIIGCIFATVLNICDFVLKIRKHAKEMEVSFKEEFMEEFKFVVKCQGNTKTVRQRKSLSNESHHSANSRRSVSTRPSSTPGRINKLDITDKKKENGSEEP